MWHHAHILESGNLQFKAYIGPRGNDEKGNDEKVGAEDEGAPVGKEMRFARKVMSTIISKGFFSFCGCTRIVYIVTGRPRMIGK